jgi:hypothetical protein
MLRLNQSQALAALKRYNRKPVLELDREAARMFAKGLGSDYPAIETQLNFMLCRYGGVTSSLPQGLVSEIALHILASRDHWVEVIGLAEPYHFNLQEWHYTIPTSVQFACFAPLRKVGTAAQIRCLTKFLHLLRPEAFVIVDRWTAAAFDIDANASSDSRTYREFADRFLEFVEAHQAHIPILKANESSESWSDTKLIDKLLLCRKVVEMSKAA